MFDTHDFSDHVDRLDPDNVVGRYVENCFGHQEVVAMQQLYWDYFDWVDQVAGGFVHGKHWHDTGRAPISGTEMIKECSYFQKGAPLSRGLRLWVDIEMKYRRRRKLPEPSWIKGEKIADIPAS